MKQVAVVYDFDGTLARGNIQEASFIPDIGMSNSAFWSAVKNEACANDADEILVYMRLMIEKAKEHSIKITKEALREHGSNALLFPGLTDGSWFQRTNRFGTENNLEIKHFIVSSGIKEMILGSPVADYMDHIFASSFIYNEGIAVWPGLAINYTTKTQYLFRINKGIFNSWEREALNAYMPARQRPVPFSRIVFIGDGDTDIPTMKMTTYQGGHAVAVYDPEVNTSALRKIHTLIADSRVDFVAPADFREHSQLDISIRGIIGRIARALEAPMLHESLQDGPTHVKRDAP